jgi:hypothetical protein
VIVVFLIQEKTKERTLLHCAIYPNAGFYSSLLNCSASGKKKSGDYHVVMAFSQCGFTVLFRSLFFLNLILYCSLNLLKCKHRRGFGVIGAGHWSNRLQFAISSSFGLTEYYLAFCFYLQLLKQYWASVIGRRFSNIPTTPSPVRKLQCYLTHPNYAKSIKTSFY